MQLGTQKRKPLKDTVEPETKPETPEGPPAYKQMCRVDLKETETERKRRTRREWERKWNARKRYAPDDDSPLGQIVSVRGMFLDRLIDDAFYFASTDVDWNKADLIKRRKAMLTLIRDEIQIVKQLAELFEYQRDKGAQEATANLDSEENVAVLEKARQTLENVKGLKTTL